MFYYKTLRDSQWYMIEARRLGQTELYELYTIIGGSILLAADTVEQIVLTNTSGSVVIYFTSPSSKADIENHFDEAVEESVTDPLTLWSEDNVGGSAYQIAHNRRSDEAESQLMDINKNLTILKKLINRLEYESNDPDNAYPPRFISISIMSNTTKDESTSQDTPESVHYLCRPIEIIADSSTDTSLTLFKSLSTTNHTYGVTNCTIKKATKAVVYGSMSYQGKHTISLVEDDLKFVLEK